MSNKVTLKNQPDIIFESFKARIVQVQKNDDDTPGDLTITFDIYPIRIRQLNINSPGYVRNSYNLSMGNTESLTRRISIPADYRKNRDKIIKIRPRFNDASLPAEFKRDKGSENSMTKEFKDLNADIFAPYEQGGERFEEFYNKSEPRRAPARTTIQMSQAARAEISKLYGVIRELTLIGSTARDDHPEVAEKCQSAALELLDIAQEVFISQKS